MPRHRERRPWQADGETYTSPSGLIWEERRFSPNDSYAPEGSTEEVCWRQRPQSDLESCSALTNRKVATQTSTVAIFAGGALQDPHRAKTIGKLNHFGAFMSVARSHFKTRSVESATLTWTAVFSASRFFHNDQQTNEKVTTISSHLQAIFIPGWECRKADCNSIVFASN